MAAYTRDQCEKWRRNKTVNPLTGRKITSTGPTYLEFKKSCAAHKIPVAAPSSSSRSTVAPSYPMAASLTRVQCKEWRKNKAYSPLSGRRINIRGAIYNAHKKSCKQYKKPSTKTHVLPKPQKAVQEVPLIEMPRYVSTGDYAKWSPLDIKKRYVFLTFRDDASTTKDMLSMIRAIDAKRRDALDDASWDQLAYLHRKFQEGLALENMNPWSGNYTRQNMIKFLRPYFYRPPNDIHSYPTISLFSISQGPRSELVKDYRHAFALYRAQRYGHDDYIWDRK